MNQPDLYTYRKLQLHDVDQYESLYRSCNLMMDIEKISTDEQARKAYIARMSSPNFMIVGCFDDNNILKATLTGFMPDDIPFWYAQNLIIDTELANGHYKSLLMTITLFNLLIDKAESQGKYWYYTRKSLRQQLLWEKIVARGKTKMRKENIIHQYKMMEYDIHYEHIYKAGERCKTRMHKFYFPNDDFVFPVDTIIMKHSMNFQRRKEILGLS